MYPRDFEKTLDQKDIPPLVFFLAEETYWQERLLKKIDQKLSLEHPDTEKIRFDVSEKSFDELLQEIQSFSLFHPNRLIEVFGTAKIKKQHLQSLEKIVAKGALEKTSLFFLIEKKETFRELKGLFQNSAVLVELTPIKPKDLPEILIQIAAEQQKKLSFETARAMVEGLGSNLLMLEKRIELLAIFCGDRKEIVEEDIWELFSNTSQKEIFALTDALGALDKSEALLLTQQLLKKGEAPLALLAIVVRHYRLLLKTKWLRRQNFPNSEIASQIRLPQFVTERYLKQSSKMPWKVLIRAYEKLFKTDLALKSSPIPALAILLRLVFEL